MQALSIGMEKSWADRRRNWARRTRGGRCWKKWAGAAAPPSVRSTTKASCSQWPISSSAARRVWDNMLRRRSGDGVRRIAISNGTRTGPGATDQPPSLRLAIVISKQSKAKVQVLCSCARIHSSENPISQGVLYSPQTPFDREDIAPNKSKPSVTH